MTRKIRIKTPSGKSGILTVPDDATDDQIKEAALRIERPDDPTLPLRARLTPKAAQAAGFPDTSAPEIGLTGNIREAGQTAKRLGQAVASPDVFIPALAGAAGFAFGGGPVSGIGAAGIAGAFTETLKKRKERGADLDLIERALPPPIQGVALVAKEARDSEDALDIIQNATIEAAIESLGFGALKVLNRTKTFSPFKSSVNPEILKLEDEFSEFGLRFNAAQKTDNFLVDKLDGIARAGYLSRDNMLRLDNKNIEAIHRISRKLGEEFSNGLAGNLTPEQIGKVLSTSQDFGRTAQKTISDRLYSEVDELVRGTPIRKTVRVQEGIDPLTQTPRFVEREIVQDGSAIVQTQGIKDLAKKELALSSQIKDLDIQPKLRRILSRMNTLEDSINFSSAQRIRSFLIELRRTTDLEPGMNRIASGVIKEVDRAMEVAANTLSPEARKAWRRANSFFRSGKETFENELMAKLFVEEKKLPSEIGKAVYNYGSLGSKGSVETIRNMKKAIRRAALLDPKNVKFDKTFSAMKQGYYNGMLNRHWRPNIDAPGGGNLNFLGLLNELDDVNTKVVMKELFTPQEVTRLRNFAKAGRAAQKVAPQAGAALGIVQSSAVFGGLFALGINPVGTVASVGAALGLPVVISKMLTNPTAIRFLTQGFSELSKGTRLAVGNGIRLSIRAGREILDQEAADEIRDRFAVSPAIPRKEDVREE